MDTNTVLIGTSSNLFKVNSNLVHEVVNAGGIPQGTYVLHGETNALLPNGLKLTPGANITIETNGQNLVIDATGAGSVTHTTGDLTINLPVLGNDGSDLKSVSVANYKIALDLETGQDIQGWDTDLDDLADGELTGSKVGAGIPGGNITTGTIDSARLDADLQDLADGELTGSKVGTGIVAGNITTGTVDPARLGGIPSATYVLHGETTALFPGGLKLTAGANITLTTNGQNLEIAGEAGGGGGDGTVTSVAVSVPPNLLSVTGSPVTTSGTIAINVVDQQANKVWAGPTSGGDEFPSFRSLVTGDMPSGVTLDIEWDTAAEIYAALGEASKTGSGPLVFRDGAVLGFPTIDNFSGANHIHQGGISGGYLNTAAIASGVFDPARLPLGVTRADRTIIVDGTNGDDGTGTRGRSDLPYQTIYSAVAALQSGDTLIIRPGTYVVTRPGLAVNSGQYQYHTTANYLVKNLRDVTILGHGAVIASTGLGNVWSITDCTNVTMSGLTMRGPGRNPTVAGQICGEVTLWGTNYNTIFTGVRFEDFPNHGILVSQGEKTSYNTLVDGCAFVRGGTTNHTTLTVDGAGVASPGPGLRVVNCLFDTVTRAVEIEGSGVLPKGPAVLAGNVMTNIINQGIVLLETSGIGTNLNEITISGNVITMDQTAGTALGQYGITASGGRRINITGNVVRRANNTGISLGTVHADLRQCVIGNNVVTECGVNIAITDSGGRNIFDNVILDNIALANTSDAGSIIAAGNATKVSGNTVADTQGFGIYLQPPSGGLGSTNIMVTDNLIRTTEFSPIGIAAGVYVSTVRGNNVTYAGSAISDSGTGSLIDTYAALNVTGSLSTSLGDVDTRLAAKMSADATTASILEESRVWQELQSFLQAHFKRAPTSDQTNYTGATFSLDVDGPKRAEWEITGDATLSLSNTGALTGPLASPFQINMYCTSSTNCVLAISPVITHGTQRQPGVIKAGEFLTMWIDYNGTNWVADWRGDQSGPGPIELGFTGETTGKARDAKDILGSVTYTSTTNAEIDAASGTVFRLDNTINVKINSVASRLSDSETNTLERSFIIEMLPPNSDRVVRINTNNFALRGLAESNFVAAGTPFFAQGANWGSAANQNYLAGGGAGVSAGGGEEASELLTDLQFVLEMQEASAPPLDLSGNGFAFAQNGGSFTYQAAGIGGLTYSVTNNSDSTLSFTNSNTALNRGGANAWTYSQWVQLADGATEGSFITGRYEQGASPAYSWGLRASTGVWRLYYSTNGTSTSSLLTDFALSSNPTHIYLVYDPVPNTLSLSINGESPAVNNAVVSLGANPLATSVNTPLSIGGTLANGVTSSSAIPTRIGQVAQWSTAKPLSMGQTLYNSAAGKPFSTW